MALLLDTNILIDHMRKVGPAIAFVQTLQGMPYASVVTITELTAGARSAKEETRIKHLTQWVRFLDVNHAIADQAGRHMKHYRSSHDLDEIDALIAATAEHHGLEFATLNVRHFPMFRRLKPAY